MGREYVGCKAVPIAANEPESDHPVAAGSDPGLVRLERQTDKDAGDSPAVPGLVRRRIGTHIANSKLVKGNAIKEQCDELFNWLQNGEQGN